MLAQARLAPLYTGVDSTGVVSSVQEQNNIAKSTAVKCSLAGTQFALPCAHYSGICSPQLFVTPLFSVSWALP